MNVFLFKVECFDLFFEHVSFTAVNNICQVLLNHIIYWKFAICRCLTVILQEVLSCLSHFIL